MSDLRVVVTDYPGADTAIEMEVLAELGGTVTVATSRDEDGLIERARNADALLVCYARITPAVIASATRLKVISRSGIGVDNVAVEAATNRGVIVANVGAYCIDEVAEHTIALLLASARRVALFDRSVRSGTWSVTVGAPIFRIRGRVLGVVGFGAIGRAVANRAKAFGLSVVAHDPFINGEHPDAPGVPVRSLDDVLRAADFVSLHLPLTSESHHLINARALSLMKPSAHLINTARGGIVDLEALEVALRAGSLAGAALDVVETEPLAANHSLLELPNVIVTPHVAFYSEESMVELRRQAARNVVDVLTDRVPASVVNAEVLQRPEWAHLNR